LRQAKLREGKRKKTRGTDDYREIEKEQKKPPGNRSVGKVSG